MIHALAVTKCPHNTHTVFSGSVALYPKDNYYKYMSNPD